MASTGFGQWYEEKKQEDGPGEGSSWFGNFGADMGDTLPLFNSEAMQNFSFANMKSAMEASMPKKILGMGYQQRFQVRLCVLKGLTSKSHILLFLYVSP